LRKSLQLFEAELVVVEFRSGPPVVELVVGQDSILHFRPSGGSEDYFVIELVVSFDEFFYGILL
jgi:hypothetical protein